LAQLTKESKYYDAIARITDALEEWQNRGTALPGMWPASLDASGCNKTVVNTYSAEQHPLYGPRTPPQGGKTSYQVNTGQKTGEEEQKMEPLVKPPPVVFKSESAKENDAHFVDPLEVGSQPSRSSVRNPDTEKATMVKRQLDMPDQEDSYSIYKEQAIKPTLSSAASASSVTLTPPKEQCIPQGLNSPIYAIMETFSLGGMSDSTYEYLLKVCFFRF
jgi:mannosyl-oligosaccharide alpha-1,2-mannosidase